MKQMNPFQKLKFTIDRIGLEYVPSNDQQTITGQTVYKYNRSQQLQQEENHVPYFRTQGHNEESFKKHSAEFRVQEIQELKAVYENQQKNLVSQINTLNVKLRQFEMRYEVKCQENQRLKQQVDSRMRQNTELRGYIMDLQQKNSRKLSQSGVLDRQRKLKEQIDRINLTVMDLAKQLNTQKTIRKNIQKQLDSSKLRSHEIETSFNAQRISLKKEISILLEQLEKRTELLQHSIKSARDEKVLHKQEIGSLKDKNELKIDSLKQQIQKLRQQIYDLKNRITQMNYANSDFQKQIETQSKQNRILSEQLNESQNLTNQLNQKLKNSIEKIQQLRLQVAYYQQQLQEQRSNTKIKVVEVRDEGLEMELAMYKKQCKELIKEKSILETVRRDKSDYTIVSENQIVFNRSE